MLRLLLILMTGVIVWILFFSNFAKRTRIWLSIGLFIATIFVLWVDSYLSAPRSNVASLSDVSVCGLSVTYSYRTNYDISLCLKNDHPSAVIRRVNFTIDAQVCDTQAQCTSVQSQSKARPIEIAPGQQITLTDSMRFDQVAALTNMRNQQNASNPLRQAETNNAYDPARAGSADDNADESVSAQAIKWSAQILSLKAV